METVPESLQTRPHRRLLAQLQNECRAYILFSIRDFIYNGHQQVLSNGNHHCPLTQFFQNETEYKQYLGYRYNETRSHGSLPRFEYRKLALSSPLPNSVDWRKEG